MAKHIVSAESEAFGAEVHRRRRELGLTLDALAQRADLTPNYIGTIEAGRRDPSLGTLCRLAGGLNCKPADLLGVAGAVKPPCDHKLVQRTFEGPFVCHHCGALVPRDESLTSGT